MPALYTHYRFGRKILSNLDKFTKKEIEENIKYYNTFNQGFDNLYYYLRKFKYYRNFGIEAHKNNIDIFFKNIIDYIKDNNLENNSKITSFLYGFINHYTIDTIIHPFINYQVKNLDIPHTKIEFMLDYYSFKKDSNLDWDNNIYKELIPKLKFDKNVISLIDYVFKNTYNIDNIGGIFNKSHNNGYYIYRYFITDLKERKTKLYRIVDNILKYDITLHQNTFTRNVDERILNNEKNNWHNQKNKEEIYNYSFSELYDMSYEIAISLIKEAKKVINNDEDITKFLEKIKLIDIKNISLFHS